MNHPYIKELQDTLKVHKKMLDSLEKRLVLIHMDYATKNEYEKNEIEITKIRTQGEIDALKKVIKAREDYFEKYMQNFVVEVEEMENNYENIIAKAKKSKEAQGILNFVDWKVIEENIQAKIKLYQRLKNLIK
jgi:hypothetical protein